MAITLKAIWGIGLKTTSFLQSLFLFPFSAVLRVVGLFPNFQSNQPTLPCSTSGSGSPSSSPPRESQHHHDNDVGDADSHSNDSNMAIPTSSAAVVKPQSQKENGPKMQPALPRTPAKENRALENASSSKTDSQLSDTLSRLTLDGTDQTATTLQDATNGIGSAVDDGASAQCCTAGEDARGLPVPAPLAHSITLTSRPKEAAAKTIELDGETVQIQPKIETPAQLAERAMHSRFMREALDMAKLALKTNETPVGCVLVHKGRIIAKGMNATNVTRNGTRHAELMAISALLSYSPSSDTEAPSADKGAATRMPLGDRTNKAQAPEAEEASTWVDVDPKDGHLYPYGQKLHPAPRVDASVIAESTLYVTVEPCVMCASLLRQLQVKKVFFGAVNDKFGGTGGVFRIHKNSPFSMASAPPSPAPQNGKGIARPVLERRPATTDVVSEEPNPVHEINNEDLVVVSQVETTNHLPGDGGNIERGYEAEGGWGRDEAVTLLRQFYVQENNRAPVPRKKEGRAARLAAMMGQDGLAAGPPSAGDALKSQEASGATTPAIQESIAGDAAEGDVAIAAAEPMAA